MVRALLLLRLIAAANGVAAEAVALPLVDGLALVGSQPRDPREEGAALRGPVEDGPHARRHLAAGLVVGLAQVAEHGGETLDALQAVQVGAVGPARVDEVPLDGRLRQVRLVRGLGLDGLRVRLRPLRLAAPRIARLVLAHSPHAARGPLLLLLGLRCWLLLGRHHGLLLLNLLLVHGLLLHLLLNHELLHLGVHLLNALMHLRQPLSTWHNSNRRVSACKACQLPQFDDAQITCFPPVLSRAFLH